MLSYLRFYAFQPFPWKMHICVPQSLWHGIHCTRCSGFQRPWLHLSCQFCWCLLLKYLFQLKRNGLQTSWTQPKLKKVEFSVNELNTVLTACRSQLFYCPCQVLVKNIILNIFFAKNWFYYINVRNKMVKLSVEYYDDVASVVVAVMYLIVPARLLYKIILKFF